MALEGGTTTVLFVCQRCNIPLKLHQSLDEAAVLQMTADLALPGEATEGDGGGAAAAGGGAGEAATETPLHGKRVIEGPMIDRPRSISETKGRASHFHVMKAARKLFDISSETTDTDHPLCEECTDGLLDELDLRLREAEEENKICREFLSRLTTEADTKDTEAAVQAAEAELAEVVAEEEALQTSFQGIGDERSKVQAALEKQRVESLQLDAEEEQHWKEYHEYNRALTDLHLEQYRVEHQYQQAYEHLEKLKKTNVYNDAFHIWHDGHFGTINGYRLGRLPSVPVEWSEINAAWGQTILLLHTMATKLGFKFTRYRLVPNGSHSRLERRDDSASVLQLSSSGGFKLFSDSKFDSAMVAFLDCLQQFKVHVEAQDHHFKLPYRINKDKIGDSHGEHSIKFQGNHEETWTKALKFMLTNLKWCLAWVCKQSH